MKGRVEILEDDVTDIKVAIAGIKAETTSAHKRIDYLNDVEVHRLRESKHEHANRIQVHESALHNLEGLMATLGTTISENAKKTGENTMAMIKLQTKADVIIYMTGLFFTICTTVGGFVGGKLLHWW